jgi:hypothetical protein
LNLPEITRLKDRCATHQQTASLRLKATPGIQDGLGMEL